jgi:hypothetical protein
VDLVVVNAHPKASVLPQELVQKPQPGVHHGKPLVVPGEVFGLRAHHLPQPVPYLGAVHVVVVDPALVAGVVGRVYVDQLHSPPVLGEEGF